MKWRSEVSSWRYYDHAMLSICILRITNFVMLALKRTTGLNKARRVQVKLRRRASWYRPMYCDDTEKLEVAHAER